MTYIYYPEIPDYPHIHAMDEVALYYADLLSISIHRRILPAGRPVIVGAHLLKEYPEDAIILNTEQLINGSMFGTDDYIQRIKNYPIIEYNHANFECLPNKDKKLIPPTYSKAWDVIQPAEEKDIDFLIYGSLNERRLNVANDLFQLGFKVVTAFNLYGKEKEALLARTKVVVNNHFYDSKYALFEVFRCGYCVSNGISTVAESSFQDSFYRSVFDFCAYEETVEKCLSVIPSWQECGLSQKEKLIALSKQ